MSWLSRNAHLLILISLVAGLSFVAMHRLSGGLR